MASYALTRYFLLYVVGDVLRSGAWSRDIVRDPRKFYTAPEWHQLLERTGELIAGIVIDLNWEVDQFEHANKTPFEYKSALKSPNEIHRLKAEIVKSYEKEVQKGKAKSFEEP